LSVRADAYDVLVAVHALTALVGFGAIALSGVYGVTAERRARPDALEEVRRFFVRPPLAEAAVLAVGVLGVAAELTDPHGHGVGQLWTTVGLVVWLGASGIWWLVVRPAERRVGEATGGAGAPDLHVLDVEGRRLGVAAALTSVLFVIALGVMIWQPG
jgi:uncharacterized membrane protein